MSINPLSYAPSYGLRHSTLENHKKTQEKYTPGSGRKELGFEKTASLLKDEESHDCLQVDSEFAEEKAERRVQAHYIRACVAYYLECSTWRGKTEYTGHSSSCGGCQGSHFSLTPNLCDDKITRVAKNIPKEGLTPKKINFLKNTIDLSSPEKNQLQAHHQDEEFVNSFFEKRVSYKQRHASFHNTSFMFQNNGTFENPSSSNKFDSLFELKIRPIEDALCAACTEKSETPKTSVEKLANISIKFFLQNINDLTKRKQDIENFISVNEELESFFKTYPKLDPQQIEEGAELMENFENMFNNLETLFSLKDSLLTKVKGVKTFKKVQNYRQDYYWLSTLLKQYKNLINISNQSDVKNDNIELLKSMASSYSLVIPKLKPLPEINPQESVDEFTRFIAEVEGQLKGVKKYQDACAIESLALMFFGVVEGEKNERRAPTDEEMKWQLIEMAKKEIPASQPKNAKRSLQFAEDTTPKKQKNLDIPSEE